MLKEQNVLQKSRTQRDGLKKSRPQRLATPLDDDTREHVLALLREGATLSEVCTERKVTSYTRLYTTRVHDPAFDAQIREAAVMGAETAISEAHELSKAAAASGNPDLMRVAESFARVSMLYAEKIAPKEFGTLVKLGNHDGGPLSVQVVSFAPISGGKLSGDALGKSEQLAVASRASPVDASFEDIDPE